MEKLTIKETHLQYDALRQTLDLMEDIEKEAAAFFSEKAPDSVITVGCGSSFSLSSSIALSVRLHLGIAATAIAGGDLMIHADRYAPLFSGNPMLITVSRSGSTSEVLYAIRNLKKEYPKLSVICIACTKDSAIAKESDFVIEIPWAFDESVCQTRSVTNLYAAAMLFIGAVKGCKDVYEGYRTLASEGESFMNKIEETAKKIGTQNFSYAAVISDGEGFGVAEEAALAFNEICYIQSTYKHLLDLRHGPIVLFNDKTLVVAKLDNSRFEYQKALAEDILKRGSTLIVISDEEVPEIKGAAAQFSFGKKLNDMVSECILLPMCQLLSYYHAIAMGVDPDTPNGLDAWIKL